jgi:uroporphyrinogen III methyltransferase/synthase
MVEIVMNTLSKFDIQYETVWQHDNAIENNIAHLNHKVVSELVDVAIYPADRVSYQQNENLDILALTQPINPKDQYNDHPLEDHLVIVGKKDQYHLLEIFNPIDIRSQYGKVYLVGAGPGDTELLTIKAKRLIENADIIFHDHLLNTCMLEATNAELVFVGKKSKYHFRKQEDTNELIYNAARNGKKVVRLKGGDPYIFGRGGEELDYLQHRMIDVEVVPGITAAMGASAYTAIPLTYRKTSGSVALLTGYPIETLKFPDTDTLVYYMGTSNIDYISSELIKRGRKPTTPVAIVRNATYPNQETKFTNLGDLAAKKEFAESPAVAIIGEVVKNRNYSLSAKPMVLVTGSNAEKYAYLGQVIHKPLIHLKPVDVFEFEGKWLDKQYDYVIFTSRYTVQYFFHNLYKTKQDARWFANKKIISIGRVTTAELENKGIIPDKQIWPESSTGIINWFRENKQQGQQLLIPRSDKSSSYIIQELKNEGHVIEAPIVYKNTMPVNAERVDLQPIGIIVFTSPSTVENFLTLYGEFPQHVKIVARGEQTTKVLQEYGIDNKQFLDSTFLKKEVDQKISEIKP